MATALATVWNFLKGHWQAALVIVVMVGAYAWVKHTETSYANTIAKLNTDHQAEIDTINKARTQEEQQHAQEQAQLQATLTTIQQNYAAAQQQLALQQTQETQQIVAKYGNDSDGMAALLAKEYGFTVVKPAAQ
jgi:hypothetical protein